MNGTPELIRQFIEHAENWLSAAQAMAMEDVVSEMRHQQGEQPDQHCINRASETWRAMMASRREACRTGQELAKPLHDAGIDIKPLLRFLGTMEIRGGGSAAAGPLWLEVKTELQAAAWKLDGKPNGKPSHAKRTVDERIAQEYYDGLEAGLWKGQADYVRERYPDHDRSWLSKLLKRVAADRS